MKLGIDLDDVLAAFIPRFREEAKLLFPGRPELEEDPKDWEWTNWGLSKDELGAVWQHIASIPSFHRSLKALPETDALTALCTPPGKHDVYFITARFATGGRSAKLQTEAWLYKQFGLLCPTVLIAKNKVPVIEGLELDAFIDDNAATCLRAHTSTNCKVTMLTREHNASVFFPDRVTDFNEWATRFLN